MVVLVRVADRTAEQDERIIKQRLVGRQGITPDSFKIGTVFTITLNPLRDGRNFGAQQGGLVMCGMSLPAGGCNADTGQAYGRGGF